MMHVPDPPTCMVLHPGFEPNCLNAFTLQNIHNIYRADYGAVRHRTEEEYVFIYCSKGLMSEITFVKSVT